MLDEIDNETCINLSEADASRPYSLPQRRAVAKFRVHSGRLFSVVPGGWCSGFEVAAIIKEGAAFSTANMQNHRWLSAS
jgi:hypothetical protein